MSLVADQCRLLPGVDPAALAAARRLGVAFSLTYVFEGMRTLLFQKIFRADYLATAAVLDLAMLALGAGVFALSFRGARQRGALLQMGE